MAKGAGSGGAGLSGRHTGLVKLAQILGREIERTGGAHPEALGNLHSHLIAASSDAGTNGRDDISRVRVEFFRHPVEGLDSHSVHGSAPAGVHGRNHLVVQISQQDREAVGGTDRHGDAWLSGD